MTPTEDQDPVDGDSPAVDGDPQPMTADVGVDLKDNDELYWVFWPSLMYPGKQHMIGWPMRLRPRTFPGD